VDLLSTSTRTSRNLSILIIALLVIVGVCACSDSAHEEVESPSPQETKAPDIPFVEEIHAESADRARSEPDRSEPSPKQAEHTIPLTLQQQVKLRPETSPISLELKLPHRQIESFQIQKQDLLQSPTAMRQKKNREAYRKLKIGGGILIDPDGQDLSERLDGAEVKFDLKWD